MNAPGDSDLQRELRTLRLALTIALVSLVILSGSLGIYLLRQVLLLRRQVDQTSRVAAQLAKNYNENISGLAIDFERQLKEYAQSHPAFKQQISRYFAPGTNAAPETAPAATPAPGLPPAAPAAPR